jgi:hypothetical protein
MRGFYNLSGADVLRFRANQPIPTARLNALVEAIERGRPIIGPGTGLVATQLPHGIAYRAEGNRGGGIWAWLAPGQSVGAASGTTKGTGTVTLFEADGETPRTGDGSTVEVKNAGGAVAGGSSGYLVKLGRMDDGGYSLDVAPCAAAVT